MRLPSRIQFACWGILFSTPLAVVLPASSQTTRYVVDQVADINPQGDSSPERFAELHGKLLFGARGSSGPGVFSTNGRSVQQLASDIDVRSDFHRLGEKLLFEGRMSGETGLFATDGATVQKLADIELSFLDYDVVYPPSFTQASGYAYFQATGPDGRQLYYTDGENVGYFEVETELDETLMNMSPPSPRVVFKDELYFTALIDVDPDTGLVIDLFKAKGTEFTRFDESAHGSFVIHNDHLLYNRSGELSKTDGTTITRHGPIGGLGGAITVGDQLFFTDRGSSGYEELHVWDGSEINEIDFQHGQVDAQLLFEFGDQLYLRGRGEDFSVELFKTNGEAVELVLDIHPNIGGRPSRHSQFLELNGEIYFLADGKTAEGELQQGIYKTDGTEVTYIDAKNGENYVPTEMRLFGDAVFVSGVGGDGNELIKIEGDDVVRFGIIPGMDTNVRRSSFVEFNDDLFFLVENANGESLFYTNGTSVVELEPSGKFDSLRGFAGVVDGMLLFVGTGPDGRELYRVAPVPEPRTMFLLILGALITIPGVVGHRRSRSSATA